MKSPRFVQTKVETRAKVERTAAETGVGDHVRNSGAVRGTHREGAEGTDQHGGPEHSRSKLLEKLEAPYRHLSKEGDGDDRGFARPRCDGSVPCDASHLEGCEGRALFGFRILFRQKGVRDPVRIGHSWCQDHYGKYGAIALAGGWMDDDCKLSAAETDGDAGRASAEDRLVRDTTSPRGGAICRSERRARIHEQGT